MPLDNDYEPDYEHDDNLNDPVNQLMSELGDQMYRDNPTALDPNTEVGRRRRSILTKVSQLTKELSDLDKLPPEPTGAGSVIHFVKHYGKNVAYNYAGVRASNGWWYVTGSRGPVVRKTWPDIVEFIRSHESVEPVIYLMTVPRRIN